jgi:hypothetical protein
MISKNDKKWLALPGWGCAVVGTLGVGAFLALRVYAGFGLSPRYALAFDDGGPILYLSAIFILPLTVGGAMLSWYFKQRAPMIANLGVLGVFLGYGVAGAVL